MEYNNDYWAGYYRAKHEDINAVITDGKLSYASQLHVIDLIENGVSLEEEG